MDFLTLFNAVVDIINFFVLAIMIALMITIEVITTTIGIIATLISAMRDVLIIVAVVKAGPLINKLASERVSYFLRRKLRKNLYAQTRDQNSFLRVASLDNRSGMPQDIIQLVDAHLDVRVDLAELALAWLRERWIRVFIPLMF